MEGIFLLVVLAHALTGIRGIIMDLNPNQSVMKIIDSLLIIVGVVAFFYGIYLISAVVGYGRGA